MEFLRLAVDRDTKEVWWQGFEKKKCSMETYAILDRY